MQRVVETLIRMEGNLFSSNRTPKSGEPVPETPYKFPSSILGFTTSLKATSSNPPPPPLSSSPPRPLQPSHSLPHLRRPFPRRSHNRRGLRQAPSPPHPQPRTHQSPRAPNDDVFDDADETDKVVSFAKILTPSDANNGGGFSVPRFCADSIFPALNYQAEPPVQTLSVTDLHGIVWDFRHIYRGTPRRHLLTTGWSKFVNHKMLVAGDSVVFMRNSRGEMFLGVRRAVRSTVSSDCASRWSSHIGGGATTTMRLKTEDQEGYGRKDFVVKAEVVEKALNVFWSAGMRVKMSVETEDSSRMTWFQGTLSSVSIPDNGPWQRSPWRMLQVTWDEPEVLQNAKRVSPWQVDYVASTPSIHTAFPPAKRFRVPLSPGLLTNAEEEFFFPVAGAPNSTMGQLNASLLNYNTFPAGMQGARQDLYCVSNLSHLLSENSPQMCTYNSFGNNVVPKLKRVSTELNIGSSQSDELSPDSQSSVHSSGTELDGNRYCNSTKVGRSSFQLFGKIIHMNQPVEGGFDDVGCTEDKGNKGYNATEEPQLLKLVLCELLVAATTKVSVQALKAGRKLTTSLTVAGAIYVYSGYFSLWC
ncbi:auxin response factor 17 [Prunus yedoensis var. nudiflora]|uniref:Auxin response factor n=1 Tax=Prunus yedoensis var. nudiflora TaxID=2094558 RepID=A0A314UJW9_PRUYE|nr:auxin response factor 17 [Prunus yedoensis var. nudiflora]